MYTVSTIFLIMVFILLIFTLAYSLSGGDFYKSSPFECGFAPFSMPLSVFSIPFFVISLMFLLFDVEIVIICFYPFGSVFYINWFLIWFLLFLILGATCYEWSKGVLSWVFSFYI